MKHVFIFEEGAETFWFIAENENEIKDMYLRWIEEVDGASSDDFDYTIESLVQLQDDDIFTMKLPRAGKKMPAPAAFTNTGH